MNERDLPLDKHAARERFARTGRAASYLADEGEKARPFCKACGWRCGGADSWNGNACKCGKS